MSKQIASKQIAQVGAAQVPSSALDGKHAPAALSPDSTVTAKCTVGAVVPMRTTKLLPFGIVGTLPNGERGIIREREIAWSEQERRQRQENFVRGSYCQVRVLQERSDHWEVSLRMAEYDPWSQLTKINVGSRLMKGAVTGFGLRVAHIELDNGIQAMLHEEELPEWVDVPIHDALWVGDRIYGSVKTVDADRRELCLSMKQLQQMRWPLFDRDRAATDREERQQQGRTVGDESLAISHVAPPPLLNSRPLSVLVIEDDPIQNQAIVQGLCLAGHRVEGVLDGETGLQKVRERPVDSIICDVNLGAQQDGIAIVQQVTRDHPMVQSVLMTDWMTANYRESDLIALNQQGVPLLIKPAMPEEFLAALIQPERFLPTQSADGQVSRRLFANRKRTNRQYSVKRELFDAVRQLRRQSGAEKVVLFRLDVVQRAIDITAQQGQPKLDRAALAQLLYSPVRDVAEDRRIARVEDIGDVEAYARYLIPLLHFRSCLGMPVPAHVRDRYALFLFHSESRFFTKPMQRDAQAIAKLIGILLERQLFYQQNAELQRTLLMGHLARGLIHETNHQMSPILFTLSDLNEQCAHVERTLGQSVTQAKREMAEMQEALTHLTDNMRQLVKTTRLFARIAVQDSEELLRIEQVTDQCIELVKDSADRAHIQINSHFPKHSLITQLKQTQVQQIIVNLLLNAIQQIERIRASGQIQVTAELTHTPDTIDVIRVTIEDDGPGIHRRQWDEVFELGMTTRTNAGSGMGLYISRRLMDDCGGRLYVGESMLHWGTKMVAEFPIYLPLEER